MDSIITKIYHDEHDSMNITINRMAKMSIKSANGIE